MSTREGHNREVRKRLKALSGKFNELYEAKVKEFDNSYSASLSWVQGIAKAVASNIDGFDLGLPAQKKLKLSNPVESTPSKTGYSTIRLPKNFELFHSFNLDRDGANRKIQNGSVLFRSLHNDMNWLTAAANTPRAAPKTPGRRNRIASNLFNKPTLRGAQTPLKAELLNQTPAPQSTPAVAPQSATHTATAPAGTPSKALFDAFTPIRDTNKLARPALVRRPLGSPYQEPSASRRVAASETRPGPQSRLAKEQDIDAGETDKKPVKRKGESTAARKLRSSVRIKNKEKLREALESDKENEADGEAEEEAAAKPKPRRIAKRKSSTKTAKRPARPAKRSRSSVVEEKEKEEQSDPEHEEQKENKDEETPKDDEPEWKEVYKNPTAVKKARRTVQVRTVSLSSRRRRERTAEPEKKEDAGSKTYVIDLMPEELEASKPAETKKPKRTVKRKLSKKPSVVRSSEAAKLANEAQEASAAQQEEERRQKEEQEREEKEKALREEAEKKEQKEREERERQEREERERREKEEREAAEREREDRERVEKEKQEKVKQEREKQERIEREEKEKAIREEKRKEKERLEKEEREREQRLREEREQKLREEREAKERKEKEAEAIAALEAAEREKLSGSNPLPELRFSVAADVSLSPVLSDATPLSRSEQSLGQQAVDPLLQGEKSQPNKAKYQLYKDGLKEKVEKKKQASLASFRGSTLSAMESDEKPRSSIQPLPNLKTTSPLPIQTVQLIADESLQGSGTVSVRASEDKEKSGDDAAGDEMGPVHRLEQEEKPATEKTKESTEREKLTNSGGKTTTASAATDPKKIERTNKSRNLKPKKDAPPQAGGVDARLEKAKLRREQQLKAKEEQLKAREEKEAQQRKQVEEIKRKKEELLLAKKMKEDELARKREESQKKMMATLEADKQKRLQERADRENQRKEQEERERKRAEEARKEKEKLEKDRLEKERLENERIAKEKEEALEKRRMIEVEVEERRRKKKEEEDKERERKLKEEMETMRRIQKQVEEEERQKELQRQEREKQRRDPKKREQDRQRTKEQEVAEYEKRLSDACEVRKDNLTPYFQYLLGPTGNDLAPLEPEKTTTKPSPKEPPKVSEKDMLKGKEKEKTSGRKTSRDLMPPPPRTPVTKTSPQLSTSPSSTSTSFSSSYSSSSTENSPISPRTPSPPRNKTQKPATTTTATTQYEISPYKSSDDEESEEEEEKPKKPIPMWARPEVLHLALLNQTQDPDEIFGDLSHESPNLTEIFNFDPASRATTNTKKRRSSGNWKKDRLTFKEKWEYKKRMGFVKK